VADNPDMTLLSNVVTSPEFQAAVDAWAQAVPDPESFLTSKGVRLPEGATLTVGSVSPGDIRTRTRTCHEVCVGLGFFKYCYERCSGHE
jgi:hypothetical protein